MKLPNLESARIRNKSEVKYYDADIYRDRSIFAGKKYFLKTYGCQMNVHDSELIRNLVEGIGFLPIDTIEGADLIILNTCAVRENAHDKVFGFLGRCKHEKEKNNPNMIISLCGCMAQEPGVCKEIEEKHKYIDLVFGTHNMHELPTFLMNKMDKTNFEVESIEGDVVENLEYKRDSKIEAWVNIMYGCDKFCTYCIVPYTRGKQRSRKSEDILKEIKDLVNKGYLEVTLLGQNVNSYLRSEKWREKGESWNGINSFATLTSIGRTRFTFLFFAFSISILANSNLSSSHTDFPISKPCALKNVYIIPPQIIRLSTLSIKFSITEILSDTFFPPKIATKGLSGFSKALPIISISFWIKYPQADGK